jgi:hypothetical protein
MWSRRRVARETSRRPSALRGDFMTVAGRAHEHDGASKGGDLITRGVIYSSARPRYESKC